MVVELRPQEVRAEICEFSEFSELCELCEFSELSELSELCELCELSPFTPPKSLTAALANAFAKYKCAKAAPGPGGPTAKRF
jgi:hypothetical protein